jgi:uncharacterized protein YaaN involved in tellurite resistance
VKEAVMTTPTASPEGLNLDIDKVLGLPKEPAHPTTDAVGRALETATPTLAVQGPTAMVCRDMLDAPTRAAVEAKAKQLFPVLYGDDNALSTFGNEAVESINSLVASMMTDLGKAADVPELTALTNELDDKLRGFTSKYGDDSAIADARATYEKLSGRVMDFLNKFRNMLEMLLKDAKGLQRFLDSLSAQLIEKQAELRLNVARCNEIYAANETAIRNMVVYIALMECLWDEANAAKNAVVIDESDPLVRDKREQRDRMVAWIGQLEVRTGEFKQRLFVAWATSPQIRNIRSISWGLAQRLGLLLNLTIPVFELTVVQWAMALQASQAADTAQAVQEANQHALEAWAQASGTLVPAAAKVIQAPSMDPSAIVVIAQSLQQQSEGFVQAYKEGREKRAAMENAMMRAAQAIATSQDKAADAIAELVSQAKTTDAQLAAPLQVPALPQVVVDNQAEVLHTAS